MKRLAIVFFDYSYRSKELRSSLQHGSSKEVLYVPTGMETKEELEVWLRSAELELAQLIVRRDVDDRFEAVASITNIVFC